MSKLLEIVNASWGWVGLNAKEIAGRNAFGNLLVVDDAGKYWRICPEELSCEVVSDNAAEFSSLVKSEEFQIDWEMSRIVKLAQASLGKIPNGRAFYLVIPGIFGGAYDETNIKSVPLEELISFSGYWAEEIKDLPDGAQIKLRIID